MIVRAEQAGLVRAEVAGGGLVARYIAILGLRSFRMLKGSVPIATTAEFLAGGGEMGAMTGAHDWSSSPLGHPESWPQSLRTAVRLVLNTNHPMFIWWGPQLIQFYNDAYPQTMGLNATRVRSGRADRNAGPRSGISSVRRSNR